MVIVAAVLVPHWSQNQFGVADSILGFVQLVTRQCVLCLRTFRAAGGQSASLDVEASGANQLPKELGLNPKVARPIYDPRGRHLTQPYRILVAVCNFV